MLELGIVTSKESAWVKVKRDSDERLFPTMPRLREVFADYAWKWMGPSVAQAGALRDKLRLVQELEEQLAAGAADAALFKARWDALAPLKPDLEQVLQTRFDGAVRALDQDREAYARVLDANRDRLLHDLLKLPR